MEHADTEQESRQRISVEMVTGIEIDRLEIQIRTEAEVLKTVTTSAVDLVQPCAGAGDLPIPVRIEHPAIGDGGVEAVLIVNVAELVAELAFLAEVTL